MESSRRAVKRIRLELDNFQSKSSHSTPDDHWRPSSPVKGLPRTPQRGSTVAVNSLVYHTKLIVDTCSTLDT